MQRIVKYCMHVQSADGRDEEVFFFADLKALRLVAECYKIDLLQGDCEATFWRLDANRHIELRLHLIFASTIGELELLQITDQ